MMLWNYENDIDIDDNDNNTSNASK